MKTIAVIPTKYTPPQFDKLLKDLHKEVIVDWILVLANRYPILTNISGGKYSVHDFTDVPIYAMWNDAWKAIRQAYPNEVINIAFLNDDIEIQPETILNLVAYLRSDEKLGIIYPDVNSPWERGITVPHSVEDTETTAGAGGMTGYCFIVKGELDIPYIDENLNLYWGDDDLVKQTIAKGYKVGKLVGVPILHAGSYSINRMDRGERQRLMEADRVYFNAKYGENRSQVE